MMDPDEEEMTPFSNGSEAIIWYGDNCDQCVKAWFPDPNNPVKFTTEKKYVQIGKYCKLQFHLDYGFIVGVISRVTADKIGTQEGCDTCLKTRCDQFSSDDDDRYKAPKRPKHPPANQISIFQTPFLNTKPIKDDRSISKQADSSRESG